MGFRIGQRVMFRDSRLQGIVRSYQNQTYFVEIEPGFEIPAKQSELIGLGATHTPEKVQKSKEVSKNAGVKKTDISPEPKKDAMPNSPELSWEKKPSFPKVGRSKGPVKAKNVDKANKETIPYPTSAKGVYELDLHLHALYPEGQMPQSQHALKLQLDQVRLFLDWAVEKRCKEVILIHGVGQGKLKEAIWQEYEHRTWLDLEDAPYGVYGRGATPVRLRAQLKN